VPVNPIVPSVTADTLVFFTVTTCAAVVDPTVVDANARDVGDTLTVSAAATPVPESATVCVPAPSTTLSVPESEPAVAGVNDTVIVQVAAAARLPPVGQVVDSANELALVPVNDRPVKLIAVALVFFTVKVPLVVLVVLTVVEGNAYVVGVTVAVNAAAAPVPLNATV
jgi:hypothetical protein